MSEEYLSFEEILIKLNLTPNMSREKLSVEQIDGIVSAYNKFHPEKRITYMTDIFKNLDFGDFNKSGKDIETLVYEIVYGDPFSKDKLTGCLNAGAFEKDLAKMIEECDEKNTDGTLVMLDIDEFMHVNKDFGHEVGDSVIKEIAQILFKIESQHLVYRPSGDEFAILFPNTEKEKVFLIMEEARKKIVESPECSRTSSTVSIGIATYPEDGGRDVEIFRKADGAMYRAKSSGRNRIALAKEEKLVTKTAHYTVEQLKQLEKLSDTTGITEAALMREALDELLKKYKS